MQHQPLVQLAIREMVGVQEGDAEVCERIDQFPQHERQLRVAHLARRRRVNADLFQLLQVGRPLCSLKVMHNRPIHTVRATAFVTRLRYQTVDRLGAHAALLCMELLDLCARWRMPA